MFLEPGERGMYPKKNFSHLGFLTQEDLFAFYISEILVLTLRKRITSHAIGNANYNASLYLAYCLIIKNHY